MPPIQPYRELLSRRPMFSDILVFEICFSNDIPYSKKLSVFILSILDVFSVMLPPLDINITYFPFREPSHPLPMCFSIRISGETSNILKLSFLIISDDADV